MSAPNCKIKNEGILKSLLILLIFILPNILNINNPIDIQNHYTSLELNNPINQLDIYSDKIDTDLLKVIMNNDNNQNLPIIVLYNYNDEEFKDELEENSNSPVYNYKIIPASSLCLSGKDLYSIAKSPVVKKVVLDRKVYPLSHEIKSFQENKKLSLQDQPFLPLVNQSQTQIGAPYLWDLGLNGSGIVIAVLDTGIDKTHPDLNDLDDNPSTDDPKIINETCFIDYNFDRIIDEDTSDKVGHGTHVAGIISGTGEASNYKYRGIAPGSNVMNVKVLSTYGGYSSWIIQGIQYAAYGEDGIENTGDEADIISLSLGGSGFIDDAIIQAIDTAWDMNKTVVIAAGNSGEDFSTIDSPGLSAKAITVGAVDSSDKIADFSSRGPSPDLRTGIDICAPGVNIISARANISSLSEIEANYTSKSGTSMATPFVSGAIALLLQSNPKLMPTTIKTALMVSAIDLGVSSYIQGAGRLDIMAAYNLLNQSSTTGASELKRTNAIDTLEIYNNELRVRIEPGFYFDFFADRHDSIPYSIFYEDIWDMFFAIRYNTIEEQKFYTSSDLIKDYPRELRLLVSNSSHKIAIESLKTPDDVFKIDIIYENYNDSKWMRISFNITSLDNSDIQNTKFYYYMDPEIYGPLTLDDEEDDSDDGEYIYNINALVANDTYYDEESDPKNGFEPNDFLGFSSMNQSIAFEVNSYSEAYSNLIDDTLTNNTAYHGDVVLVQEWLNSTFTPNSNAYIPIILAFGHNESNFIDNINEGKNTPLFKLDKPDIAINTLSIPNPIYNGTQTSLNISLINIGFSTSSKFNVSTYIDSIKINQTEINGLLPNEETIIKIPVIFNSTGSHNITIIADFITDEFEESYLNNEFQQFIKVITKNLATFFPYSPLDNPLNLKYAGQYLYWNCTILQGEALSDLKLKKTGNDRSFLSFNSNPTSIDEVTISEEVGQSFVNISVNIPKDTPVGNYQFHLQLINSSDILYEIPIEFEIIGNIPLQLFINQSRVDDYGPEDEDGIVEGDEYGSADFLVQSADTIKHIYEVFMIITSKNHSSIEILDYNIDIDHSIYANESEWSSDDFVFSVPYNVPDMYLTVWSVIFAKIGNSDDFIPFFQQMINYSIHQRIPGIPDLKLDSVEFTELIYGDNDGILEPGETGYVKLNFKNIGYGSALQIFNTNITCSDSRVTLYKPFWIFYIFAFPTVHIQWNGIEPDEITKNSLSYPIFTLSDSIAPGEVLHFEIEMEYCNITGDMFNEKFQFSYTVPLISDNGNGNGKSSNEDDIMGMILIIGISSVGGTIAVVSIIIIKKKKSKLSRQEIN